MKFQHDLTGRNIYNYKAYRELIDTLLLQKKTTGENHSEAMLNYTNMNVARMNRLDKRAKLNESIERLIKNQPKQTWLIISEAWCGDAAQNLPFLVKMAELNNDIEVKIILRDENLDIMDDHLTNGGRSIPKLIAISEDEEVLFDWGPRPEKVQKIYTDLRESGKEYSDISTELHTWYAKDKGTELLSEFEQLFEKHNVIERTTSN